MPLPHLVHVFSTFAPAGPQVRTVKLLAHFGARARHTIVAMDGRTDARDLLGSELDVRFAAAPPKAGTLATVPRMRALLRELAPQRVLTYNFGAIDSVIASRTLGVSVLHHEDGFLPDEAQELKLRRSWMRRACLRGDVDVVVISANLQRIASERWHVRRARLHFVPNGIELERYEPRDGGLVLRASLGIAPSALVVGAVGHLRPEKNLPRLLNAVASCARSHDVHALLLGDGPERAALESLARSAELAGRVHFAGYQADPRAYYRAMDVFALTSDTEQMPIALLEAMASALPVVATDVGDVRAMLPDAAREQVVALGPECGAALARALLGLATDATARARLG
ncbi:MAG: glycosyltransferase, partial [Planctomycetes bacterium]|nr:glycosyltransferase [Planctomycetota bacterium]